MPLTAFAFRREVEAAVVAQHGEISLLHAATIQTATRHELTAQLAKHWLTASMNELTHSERLQFAREVSRQSAERDRCLRSLSLGRDAHVLDALYSAPIDVDADEPGNDGAASGDGQSLVAATSDGDVVTGRRDQ